jgi:penicillin-binding protein 2
MERIKKRLVWTLAMLVFFFILAAARTGYIQVARGEHYARKAMAGEAEGISLEEYTRGSIMDRNLIPLSGTYRANRILVFPSLVENPGGVALGLSIITGMDFSTLKNILSDKKPAVLPVCATENRMALIREYGWKGVLVVPYCYRYGPRPLAVHMVGHLGRIRDLRELEDLSRPGVKKYRLSDWVGRQGLEYFYEKDLRGLYPAGFAGVFTDALGRALPGKPVTVDTKMGDFTRSDVITTIDAGIQDMVERVMDRHVKKGAVVVMDRSTGDILAVASRPAYNPDPAGGGLDPAAGDGRFVNQAVSLFQPGSIFKVVVAVAALSEGMAKPDTLFYCRGSLEKTVRCWKEDGHGPITLSEAFAQSCNPVFAGLGLELGPHRLIKYARAMGLDNQGIIGYPAAPDRRQDLGLIAGRYNLAGSSVGQGPVLATPVQVTAMVNTVANSGVYLQPRLVGEIRPARGESRKISPGEPVRAIAPEVARQVGEMMVMATKQGVGQKAWVAPGGTAGKTGSAQQADNSQAVNAWFSGYGPLDNPRYTVTVLVREGNSGGETAAPVFREIMKNLME